MSRQPPRPPPPSSFPEAYAHTGSTHTRQAVTGDPAYPHGGPVPGQVYPPQSEFTHMTSLVTAWCTRLSHDVFLVSSPAGYSSQLYSSAQPPPTPSHRSTLAASSAYNHASLPPHPPASLPLSGSTYYDPSFPVPDVPARYPPTNPSGPPLPPPLSPTLQRAATMPMPVHPNIGSSVPYDGRPQYAMHAPSHSGIPERLPPTTQSWSYRACIAAVFPTVYAHNKRLTVDVHDRDDDSSTTFSDEDVGPNGEGSSHVGGYMRERGPPNHFARGRGRDCSTFSRLKAPFLIKLSRP